MVVLPFLTPEAFRFIFYLFDLKHGYSYRETNCR
jgi:hypothetical protein